MGLPCGNKQRSAGPSSRAAPAESLTPGEGSAPGLGEVTPREAARRPELERLGGDESADEPAVETPSLREPLVVFGDGTGSFSAMPPEALAPNASPVPPPLPLPEAALRGARRLAWGGDGRRGTARLEIAEGPLAGAEIAVEVDGREVAVSIAVPSGTETSSLAEELRSRLERRGLSVRGVDVT